MNKILLMIANAIASKLIDKIYDEMTRKKIDMENVPEVLAPVDYAREDDGERNKGL